ncbi:hypothetical protein D3C81_1237840 [compost metagenome]
MNRNSERNRPTPTAPADSAAPASSAISILASSSISSPSSVTAGVWRSRCRRFFSSARSLCRWRYSSRMMAVGSTITSPASPSMMIQSSWRISSLALCTPTAAGISRLRATMAVCEVRPPRSVTKPWNTVWRNCSMSAGAMSWATTITPGAGSPSAASAGTGAGTSTGAPASAFRMRSTTCRISALRSRRYSSSISSNWRISSSSRVVSAHSAL